MAYYGNTSESRKGTLLSLALRPGEAEFNYNGEYIALNANAYVQSAGGAAFLVGLKNIVSCLNGSGRLATGIGAIFSVIPPSGVVNNAIGLQVQSVQAQGTSDSDHTAIGVDIGNGGSGINATGSSGTNKAVGLRISNISGSQVTKSIECNSTAESDFQGPMNMYKGVKIATSGSLPTASSALRGTIWMVQGDSGVADTLHICMKDASDSYIWVTL